MPKVPEARIGGVQTRALPGARFTTNVGGAFQTGARVQRAAGELAGAIGEAFSKEAEKADKSKVRVDTNKLKSRVNNLLRGDGDQEPGYFSFKGADANKQKSSYNEKFQKIIDQSLNEASNSRQRELLEEQVSGIKLDWENRTGRHAFAEVQRLAKSESQAAVNNNRDDIILNWREPNRVQAGLAEQKKLINDLADIEGLGREARDKILSEGVSEVHLGVLAQMLSDNEDLTAKKYMKDFGKEFTSEDKLKAQSMLEEGSTRGESQRQADKIIGLGLSQSDALAKAREIEDPKIKDETVRRIKIRFQEQRQIKDEARRALFEQSFNKIEQSSDPKREDVPSADWAQMTPNQQKTLISWIDSKKKGKTIHTNWTRYHDLKLMASTPASRDAFLKTNLLEDRMKLGDTEFKELLNLQADMRSGKTSAISSLKDYRTERQIVDDSLKASGFDLKTTSRDKIRELNEIRAEIGGRIINAKERKGVKNLESKDIQDIVDVVTIEATDSDSGFFGFFQTKKRGFELPQTGDSKFSVDLDDVPPRDKRLIEETLRKNGVEVSDDAIINLYLKKLNRVERQTR